MCSGGVRSTLGRRLYSEEGISTVVQFNIQRVRASRGTLGELKVLCVKDPVLSSETLIYSKWLLRRATRKIFKEGRVVRSKVNTIKSRRCNESTRSARTSQL